MDQIKTGKFIAEMRKAKSLTQRQLADVLGISDKTVSKWECGNGMPELSLILPLCQALDADINELFAGERIIDADYKKKAEETIMSILKEKEENRKKIIMSVIVAVIGITALVTLILVTAYFDMSTGIKLLLIAIGCVLFFLGVGVACVIDRGTGVYECRKCRAKFTPDMKSYIVGAHSLTTRYLKCPKCGKSSFCKHRLSR